MLNSARRRSAAIIAALLAVTGLLYPSRATAQQPAAPPTATPPAATPPPDAGTWFGTASAGLALTSGNSDTLNINLAFDVTRHPKTRNLMKWTGLYIRGELDDSLVANRLSLSFRDQYALTDRGFIYGELDYLRDTFKLIDYLVSPMVGAGYKLVDTQRTQFSVDGGIGGFWEKNPDLDVRAQPALAASEKLELTLTPTSTIKHSTTALWNASDLSDGLYIISIGLATQISEQFHLSIDVFNHFKQRTPTPDTEKNDVVLVTAFTVKF